MLDETAVRAFIDEAERVLGARWTEVTEWLQSRQSLAAIETLVAAGRGLEALSMADLTRAAEAIAADRAGVYAEAAARVAGRLTTATDNLVRYDGTNSHAVTAIRTESQRVLEGIATEQRETTRAVLADGLARGANPRESARAIRASIGLTATQARAVETYRAALESAHEAPAAALDRELSDGRTDRSVASAARRGAPLSEAQIETAVTRYRANYVAYRAETIARTASMRAVHAGADEAWRQAIASGAVKAETLTRTWHAARDARTRDSHRAMHGQRVKMGEAFTTGTGVRLMYPGDPSAPAAEVVQCRCAMSVRMTS